MGAAHTPPNLRALIEPDERLSFDTVAAQGAGALNSSFSQAGPKPGLAEPESAGGVAQDPDMVLELSGTQSAGGHLEFLAIRGGMPGVGRAQFAWRDREAGDTTSQYRGWSGYQAVLDWTTLRAATGTTLPEALLDAVRLPTGRVLIAGDQDDSANGYRHKLHSYSPVNGGFDTYTFTPEDTVDDLGPGLCPLEDGSCLFITRSEVMGSSDTENVDVYRTVNGGVNWTLVQRRALDTGISQGGGARIREIRARSNNGEILLLIVHGAAAGAAFIRQYGSSDGGESFQQVGTWSYISGGLEVSLVGRSPSIVPIASGGYLVAYRSDWSGADKYLLRRVGGAFILPAVGQTDVQLSSAAPAALAECAITLWRDEDDVLYTIFLTASGTGRTVAIRSSTDDGDTWSSDPAVSGSTPPRDLFTANGAPATAATGNLRDFAACSTAGRGLLVTRWNATTGTHDPQSIGVAYLGGFASHTVPLNATAVSAPVSPLDYCSFGYSDTRPGHLYLPIDKPNNLGWSTAGTGADANSALTAVGSETILRIDTTGGLGVSWNFRRTFVLNTVTAAYMSFAVDEVQGGDVGTDRVAAKLRISDSAAWTYGIEVRFSGTEFRLYDPGAGANIGAAIAAAGKVRIAVALSKTGAGVGTGKVLLLYSTSTGHDKIWTVGQSGTLTNAFGGGLTDNSIGFGHHVDATQCISDWWVNGACFWAGPFRPGSTLDIGDAAEYANPESIHGAPFGLSPRLIFDGLQVAAKSGPARVGDTWQARVDYDYGIENIHYGESSTPTKTWRSTDTTEQIITWDWLSITGGSRFGSTSVGIALLNINFPTAHLEGYASGAWATLATVNGYLEFGNAGGLNFARNGDRVTVGAASPVGTRHLAPGELAGSWCRLNNGGANAYRHIRDNEEGAWRDAATVLQPALYLSDAASGDPTTGLIWIGMKNVVLVAHGITGLYEAIRLRIPATTIADSYFEIGQVIIGRARILGPQYSHGWAQIADTNVEEVVRPSGRRRPLRRGPAIKEVEVHFSDADDLTELHATQPNPDYIGDNTGLPIATRFGATTHLWHRALASGGPARPVVWVGRVLQTAALTQVTDPLGWVYGTLQTSPRLDNVLGSELQNPVWRMPRTVIRGLP